MWVPWTIRHAEGDDREAAPGRVENQSSMVVQRYCHVFKDGELEDLCDSVAGCELQRSWNDQGNWTVILTKQK